MVTKERGRAGAVSVGKDKPLHVYIHNNTKHKLDTVVVASDDRIDVYINDKSTAKKEGV